jgi:hypothetical protein
MVSVVLPLFYGKTYPGRGQKADSQMESNEKARQPVTQKLPQGRYVLPKKTETSPFAMGLRQQKDLI